jgi:hypothetical protein
MTLTVTFAAGARDLSSLADCGLASACENAVNDARHRQRATIVLVFIVYPLRVGCNKPGEASTLDKCVFLKQKRQFYVQDRKRNLNNLHVGDESQTLLN